MASIVYGLALAAIANAAAVPSLPKGAITLDLIREVNYFAYLTKFGLGTPAQYEYLEVDTGSPQIAFENPKNNVCSEKSQPCKLYGTFTNTSSSTCRYVGSDFNDELIDFGNGDILEDTLHIGSLNVPNFKFGYVNDYSFGPAQVATPTKTICGLGLSCSKFDSSCYKSDGTQFLLELYNQEHISKRAVSVYLGPEQPGVKNAQVIVGNAYDKAKQGGKPFTVPMVPGQGTTNWVNTSAISVTINGTTTRLNFTPHNVTLLDTGNPEVGLPNPIWKKVQAALHLPNGGNVPYKGKVDCSLRKLPSTDRLTVEFGSAENIINVPLAQTVTDFGDGECGSFLYSGGPSSSGLGALGDPFLRSVYMTLDQDDFTVTLAQAKFTSATDYVPLS